MDDVAGLLESEEMKAVISAIDALRRRYPQSLSLPKSEKITFMQMLKGKFPVREVLRVLADKHPGYPGKKDVLAAAFAAWLLFPKDKEIRENWMTHAMLIYLDKTEKSAGLYDGWTLERDIAARYIFAGDDFLRDMLDNAGGYQAFMRATTLEVLDAILDHNIRTIRTATRSMVYLHHGAQLYVEGGVFYRPSVNRAYKIFETIRISEEENRGEIEKRNNRKKKDAEKEEIPPFTYVGRSSLHKIWKENKGALPLLYAASCLKATRAKSLLDILLNAEFSHGKHTSLIPQWLGMARYAADSIFPKMGDPSLMKNADRLLGDIAPLPFPAPVLNEMEGDSFKRNFRRYFQSDS